MNTKILSAIACICMVALLFGCAPTKQMEESTSDATLAAQRTFKFTASATQAGNVSEWKVDVDAQGALTVMRKVGNQAGYLGTYNLSADEAAALWEGIDSVFKGKIETSGQKAAADEVKYTMILNDNMNVGIINLWGADAQNNSSVSDLIGQIDGLIEKHTGETSDLQ